ncbi:branched-chain amino acid ABC transporter permease [Microvirga sp. KLBC 81]|nr:branched-chain amino acid ABC transporter permease [Microvirga sp. KLBC 81]
MLSMLTNPTILGQIVVNGMSLSSVYILVALGFTLLFGIMRVVNFAHGEFAMLGGFAMYYLYAVFSLPWVAAILLAPLAVAIPALFLEWLVFRWFYQKMFQSMIGLLGLSIVMIYSALLTWDAFERNIPAAFDGILRFAGVILPIDRLVTIGVSALALGAFYFLMVHTRIGLAMRAAAQDVEIAGTQGIDTRKIYRAAFFVAILLAALAGALYGQIYAVSPFMGERPLFVAFIVVILGGMGSIPGAALGGLILGFTESFLGTFYGGSVASYASFGAVILLLIFRPWGLLGKPE